MKTMALIVLIFWSGVGFAGPGPVDSPARQVYWKFLDGATYFLGDHLRWPIGDEAESLLLNAKASVVRSFAKEEREAVALELANLDVAQTLRLSEAGVIHDFRGYYLERYLFVRRKLATAYNRAIRQTDLEARYRTVPRTPSMDLFFYSMIKTKSNGGPKLLADFLRGSFSLEHLRDLLEPRPGAEARSGDFPQPLIFTDGLRELEQATRFDTPFAFRSYVDTALVTEERAEKTRRAIEHAKGFAAISWTSGKPLNADFLETLLAMVEERDWILLVCPTQQIYEGLPEIFLHHPRIHLLTHTIENRYLKLSNIPINPNVEDPLSLMKKAGSYKPGQTVVVFHPHLMMESIATTTNEYLPVQIWSSGSINEPLGAFTGVSQGGRNVANKVFHKMKFLAFEKGDGHSRYDHEGLQNVWHARPVSFYNDVDKNGTAGFIDMSRSYQVRYDAEGARQLRIEDEDPEYIYLGDPHDRVTDPRFVQSLVEDLRLQADTRVTFIAGDAFDGGSINHWLNDKSVALNLKFQGGGMSALEEVNGLITTLNALLQRYPNARFAQIVGNHDEWLTKLLEKTPDIQDVINGDFLDELSFAVKTLKFSVWEYIFKHRQEVMGALLNKFPDKRREIIGRVLPIYAVDRIDIITRGQNLFTGPPWRKNALQFHGDKSSGPRPASFKDHAKAMPEGGGVTAHTHKPCIHGEVYDVGSMAENEQDYTRGNYANQGQGLAPVYANGTKQLYLFSRLAGSFRQRQPQSVLSEKLFFGDDPLRVVANDNDLVNKVEGEQLIQAELQRLQERNAPCADLLKRKD